MGISCTSVSNSVSKMIVELEQWVSSPPIDRLFKAARVQDPFFNTATAPSQATWVLTPITSCVRPASWKKNHRVYSWSLKIWPRRWILLDGLCDAGVIDFATLLFRHLEPWKLGSILKMSGTCPCFPIFSNLALLKSLYHASQTLRVLSQLSVSHFGDGLFCNEHWIVSPMLHLSQPHIVSKVGGPIKFASNPPKTLVKKNTSSFFLKQIPHILDQSHLTLVFKPLGGFSALGKLERCRSAVNFRWKASASEASAGPRVAKMGEGTWRWIAHRTVAARRLLKKWGKTTCLKHLKPK